jgi:hypothetical protein
MAIRSGANRRVLVGTGVLATALLCGSLAAGDCGPSYVLWSTPTDYPGAPMSIPVSDRDAAWGVLFGDPPWDTYVSQGTRVYAFRNASEGTQAAGSTRWIWTSPMTPIPGAPAVSSCTGGRFIFVTTMDGQLCKVHSDGLTAASVDTRRPTHPLDRVGPPTVLRWAFSSPTFHDWIDSNFPVHLGDDLVLVVTETTAADPGANRVIAYWASDMSVAWTFNADGAVPVGASHGGCAVDYEWSRVYLATKTDSPENPSLFALNALGGALLWSTAAGNVVSRPVLVPATNPNRVYVANMEGGIQAYGLAGDGFGGGLPLWATPVDLDEALPTEPAPFPGGLAVVDSDGTLRAFVDGGGSVTPAWTRHPGPGKAFRRNLVALGDGGLGKLLAGCTDGRVRQVDAATGLPEGRVVVATPSADLDVLAALDGDTATPCLVLTASGGPNSLVARIDLPLCPPLSPPLFVPTAGNDAYPVFVGTARHVGAPGVLADDSYVYVDPDGTEWPMPIVALLVSPPAHGTLDLDPDGSFDYVPDPGFEGVDSFGYVASNGEADSTPATVTLTVAPAPVPTITIAAVEPTVTESGLTGARLAVTRIGGLPGDLVVAYTVAGTASPGGDYTALSGTAVIPAGSSSMTLEVAPIDDAFDEADETVVVTLDAMPAYVLGADTSATATILDDDVGGAIQFRTSVFKTPERGGVAIVTVSRRGGAAGGVTVHYATADGSATAGADYTAVQGTLTFDAGVSTRTFKVPIRSDRLVEGTETILLVLSDPQGGATLGSLATATLEIQE